MAELIYSTIDLERPIGIYLYGQEMYETMVFWASHPTTGTEAGEPDASTYYARIWQAASKVVYSSTLESVSIPDTRLHLHYRARPGGCTGPVGGVQPA